MTRKTGLISKVFIQFVLIIVLFSLSFSQNKKALSVTDIMKFQQIQNPVISENGKWLAYTAKPDRGDGEVMVHSTFDSQKFTIKLGSRPVFSKNSNWVAATLLPEAAELAKSPKNKPKNGLALLNIPTGKIESFEKVQKFVLSNDSKWLVYLLFKIEQKKESGQKEDENTKSPKKNIGTDLILRNLATDKTTTFHFVKTFALDSSANVLTFTIADSSGTENGLYFLNLQEGNLQQQTIIKKENGYFDYLTWNNKKNRLAFLSGTLDDEEEPGSISVIIWDPKTKKSKPAITKAALKNGWTIHTKNDLQWTRDGNRLFIGVKPESEIIKDDKEKKDQEKEIDLFNTEEILSDRGVDIWHWDDPLINSNQKKNWSKEKDRTYRGVYFLDSGKFTPLADKNMPDAQVSENPRFTLGISNVPYLKKITWFGRLNDYYLVDLKNGSRKKIVLENGSRAALSPRGNFVIYYNKKHWFLYDTKTGKTKNLTENIGIPFYNEDHDFPSPVQGYGVAGWLKNDKSVLIYDKYDIWQFPTNSDKPVRLTEGRKDKYIFRIQRINPQQRYYKKGETLLLTGYHDLKKTTGFYSLQTGKPGVKKLLEEDKKFTLISKAKQADVLLFSRQSYTEFPDLWISDLSFDQPKKITDVNPQVNEFAWGSAELVAWHSLDGIPLQGVLIKPGNYNPEKKYPVLVYYYRFFSQRLHEFNQVVINHRPCFPFYASNGYAVFLPDIRFEVGRPGFAATKCLVPGVQKLIDMGIADPDAIALHGHSWSGYQTAFVITQTDIFKCAIAGAPVSNMTSAYGGIRWGSGLARQFQYEQTQSRIGGTLWNALNRYIENSPLFFADKINTPLLIMHGDIDDAVPWYQSIELYLAMRRLEKDCIFLQYRNEPHHPQRYPNKLDYTLKMKEYMDFYLKGQPAAKWITEGVLYKGR